MIATGIRSPSSLGVSRYCERLAGALAGVDVDYRLAARPGPRPHWHLANSSRAAIVQAPGHRGPYVVTAHDVLPRSRPLVPLYRRVVFPFVLRRASVVVAHSSYAAGLLRSAGVRRVEVVPHAATSFASLDRTEARHELGWDEEEQIALLPGVPKAAKLVDEARAAVGPPWRLVVLGVVDDRTYRLAFAAADCVLVLRRDSVGESNGPLLDALGAGRAVLATATGSIAEVAAGAAVLCEPATIRAGLDRLRHERDELEARARERAAELSWAAAARAHADLLGEVFA